LANCVCSEERNTAWGNRNCQGGFRYHGLFLPPAWKTGCVSCGSYFHCMPSDTLIRQEPTNTITYANGGFTFDPYHIRNKELPTWLAPTRDIRREISSHLSANTSRGHELAAGKSLRRLHYFRGLAFQASVNSAVFSSRFAVCDMSRASHDGDSERHKW
jgi:hypothetical protein